MMMAMTTTPTPLVTREALLAFTQRLVECYAPDKVILFGSLARVRLAGIGCRHPGGDALSGSSPGEDPRNAPTLPGAIPPGSAGAATRGN
jgi:hypothetical protein